MASPSRGRHARQTARRLRISTTGVAVGALALVFVTASVLVVRVLTVPADLRKEGAAAPSDVATRQSASVRARPTKSRAARSALRGSPSPAAKRSGEAVSPVSDVSTTPAARSASPRPSPSPSPSPTSSSSRPLPIPTLTRPAHH